MYIFVAQKSEWDENSKRKGIKTNRKRENLFVSSLFVLNIQIYLNECDRDSYTEEVYGSTAAAVAVPAAVVDQ